MPPGPTAADITIRETLGLLDGPFASLASAVAKDEYAFWLGSGISLGRVEGLRRLIPRVLDHLQQRVAIGDPACRFRGVLEEIGKLAGLSAAERAATNFEQPVATWPTLPALVDRLMLNYARFLDLAPAGEEPDYLLWEGVNVASTYANPATEPDTEHLCLALLALEGVISQMPTANWDGLIERAVELLVPGHAALVVCVVSEDLRHTGQQSTLYKFHGCAVRARDNPAVYRAKLVGSAHQINDWGREAKDKPIVNRLMDLAATRRSLMVGLSVQDSNIQGIFAEAKANMAWGWPIDPPAYAFSEDELGFDQRSLLQNVYRGGYTAATRDDIYNRALVRSYAKPLLVALSLHILFAKLHHLLDLAPTALTPPERASVSAGLTRVRNAIADRLHPAIATTVYLAIRHVIRFMAMFHDGDARTANLRYRPVSGRPTQHLATDPALATAGLRELAATAGLLGIGIEQGYWAVQLVDIDAQTDGAFALVSGGRGSKLFVVANTTAATRLRLNGHFKDGDDAIIVHALDIAPAMPRSPRPRRARTGAPGVRQASMAALLAEATTANDLMQRFREEASV